MTGRHPRCMPTPTSMGFGRSTGGVKCRADRAADDARRTRDARGLFARQPAGLDHPGAVPAQSGTNPRQSDERTGSHTSRRSTAFGSDRVRPVRVAHDGYVYNAGRAARYNRIGAHMSYDAIFRDIPQQ